MALNIELFYIISRKLSLCGLFWTTLYIFYISLFYISLAYICIEYTPCLRKNYAKLFLSELCQMSINCSNFWQVDYKATKIICYINIFRLTSLMSSQYLVKQKSAKFYNA